ncbi:MAG: M48 family metallopeptidase [Candidatus Omnitrophica bacterium]|nr:M48 family metallopeptidase [Candidatus Omnitrophota bacterium]
MKQITLGDISVDVAQKDIKNVHLSVYPPSGRVRISAPLRMNLDTIRVFAISKLSWIKKQQKKFHNQVRETPREYITRESHYYLGKRYLLRVIEHDAPPKVTIKHDTMEMCVRPKTGLQKRQGILDEWYRHNLKEIIPGIISRYEKTMKITVNEFGIKKMRTRWGTCSRIPKRIWLNLELAKKPKEYIEYIVVHEMIHLLERRHNERFVAFMDQFLAKWRFYKEGLNRIPLRHENWSY